MELSAFYSDTASLIMGKHKRMEWFLQKKKQNGDENYVDLAYPLTEKYQQTPFLWYSWVFELCFWKNAKRNELYIENI